jgi:16S rRNA (cytidine1402-2'-O)-methyltransferase
METISPALYLIPVPLGDTPVGQVLPSYNREVILQIRHFIVEEIRSARRFLKSVDKDINIDELEFYPMGKHADTAVFREYLKPLVNGEPVGVISEAGCPAVADPGAVIVEQAHQMQLKVVPLVGPSSILLALMASGFNGQNFAFNGYIPIDNAARIAFIKRMEERAVNDKQTQICIETPYRNELLFRDFIKTCRNTTRLCAAAGITCQEEYIQTYTIQEWKKRSLPNLRKTPAIFLID